MINNMINRCRRLIATYRHALDSGNQGLAHPTNPCAEILEIPPLTRFFSTERGNLLNVRTR